MRAQDVEADVADSEEMCRGVAAVLDSDDDADGLEVEEDFNGAHERRLKPLTAIQRDGRLARDTGEHENEDDNARGRGVASDELPCPQQHKKATSFLKPSK